MSLTLNQLLTDFARTVGTSVREAINRIKQLEQRIEKLPTASPPPSDLLQQINHRLEEYDAEIKQHIAERISRGEKAAPEPAAAPSSVLWEGNAKSGNIVLNQAVFGKAVSLYIQENGGSIENPSKITVLSFRVPQKINRVSGYRIGGRINYKQYEFELDETGTTLTLHNTNNEYVKNVCG